MAVSDRIRKVTHDGQIGQVRIHYPATKAGGQQAQRDASDFASLGYDLVGHSGQPGHLNVGRSAAGAAAAFGMAHVVGVGLFRTSHSAGDIVLTYQKVRPSEAQRAEEQALQRGVGRTSPAVATEYPALAAARSAHVPASLHVDAMEPSTSGLLKHLDLTVTATVANLSSAAWDGLELEAVTYSIADPAHRVEQRPQFRLPLKPGGSGQVRFTVERVPKGKLGILAAISRVLQEGTWIDAARLLPRVAAPAHLPGPAVAAPAAHQLLSDQVRRNVLGKELERRRRLDEAIVLYEANVAQNADSPFPYERLMVLYRRLHRYDDEIRVIEAAARSWANGRPMPERLAARLAKAKQLRARAAVSTQS